MESIYFTRPTVQLGELRHKVWALLWFEDRSRREGLSPHIASELFCTKSHHRDRAPRFARRSAAPSLGSLEGELSKSLNTRVTEPATGHGPAHVVPAKKQPAFESRIWPLETLSIRRHSLQGPGVHWERGGCLVHGNVPLPPACRY